MVIFRPYIADFDGYQPAHSGANSDITSLADHAADYRAGRHRCGRAHRLPLRQRQRGRHRKHHHPHALGVSGGIAAYKAAEIVRHLQDRGVRVQVIMTAGAQEFVRPLTFAALSGEKVITSMFGSSAEQPNLDSAVEHISVAQSIDCLLVAPATADTIARFAQGISNDFLSTLYLATQAPVISLPQ